MEMCVLAVFAYRNSFIHFKLLIMPIAYLRLFLACRRKEMKKKRVNEKLTTFFTKNRISKRMSRKGVALSDNMFTMGCCKVLSSLNIKNYFSTMKNSYHKALIPSRLVNYYKHVKFASRDNIT